MPANTRRGPAGSVSVTGLIEVIEGYSAMSDRGVERVLTTVVSRLAKEYAEKVNEEMSAVFDNPTPFTKRAASYDRARFGAEPSARTYIRPKQEDYLYIQEEGGTVDRGERTPKGGQALPLGIVDPSIGDRYGNLGPKGIKRRVQRQSMKGVGRKREPVGKKRLFVTGLGKGANRTYGLWVREKIRSSERSPTPTGGASTPGAQPRGPNGRFQKRKPTRVKGQRNPSWRTRLLVAFQDRAKYEPRFRFEERALAFGAKRLPRAAREAVFRQLRFELRRGRGR